MIGPAKELAHRFPPHPRHGCVLVGRREGGRLVHLRVAKGVLWRRPLRPRTSERHGREES